ncbi:MAG: hypothetical protein HY942_04565 [Gammaproteobacteria bacterium]|nr:hypothetical protein [Gammaproteobacteria bacterium]
MKKIIVIAGLALTLGACAGMQSTQELDDTIAQAEKEIAATKKSNALWRDTEKFLEDAKKAKADGDVDGATKLAKKALTEAKLAQKQAQDQAKAKPVF